MMKKALLTSSLLFLVAANPLPFPTAPARAGEQALSQANNPASTPQTEVQILDFGAESSRRALRFQPIVNAQQTIKIVLDTNLMMAIAGQAAPEMPLPSSEIEGNLAITRIDPNGDIHARFLYTRADVKANPAVRAEVVEIMRQQLQTFVGLEGTIVMDNRGNTKTSSFAVPETVNPALKQMLDQFSNSLSQMSTPLPEEEIGKGAKWRVTNRFSLSGIQLTQTSLYELVNLEGDRATLNVTVEQSAPPQPLNLAELPQGATASIRSMNARGTGKIELALDRAMPVYATLSMNSDNEMAIKLDESTPEMPVSSKVSIQMRFESNE